MIRGGDRGGDDGDNVCQPRRESATTMLWQPVDRDRMVNRQSTGMVAVDADDVQVGGFVLKIVASRKLEVVHATSGEGGGDLDGDGLDRQRDRARGRRHSVLLFSRGAVLLRFRLRSRPPENPDRPRVTVRLRSPRGNCELLGSEGSG